MEWVKDTMFFLTVLSLKSSLVEMVTVQQIYIKDNKPAVKGGEIQIVCEISGFTSSDNVYVYKTDNQPPQSLTGLSFVTNCIPSLCLGSIDRHTFSADSSKITITVNNVNRAEDQKWWTCVTSSSTRKSMYLTVYTVTTTLDYDNRYTQEQDLVQNAVTWKCSTGCAYPAPSFIWYYTESSGSRQEWSTSDTVTDKVGGCSDSERIYTSTLSLPRYTVFSDNTDKTVKFQCGAVSVTGKPNEKFTPTTVNVQFAVRVTSVILKDGDTTPSGTLEVNNGVPKTLKCTTSVSRPTATVIWYIGNEEKKRSTDSTSTFTFTPTNSDHGKKIYCKAFNIQPENQAVISNEPTLYVKVHVTSVTLKDGDTTASGTLEVTSAIPKTLTCTTSVSRPTATVIWYIGNVEKKRSTDSTSTFTFTPTNSEHGKKVYCKAFNIQPENQAVISNEPTIYVKVRVTSVTLKDGNTIQSGTLEVTSGVSKTLACTTSVSRPTATVIWYIGNVEKNRSTDTTSTFTFTPTNSDHGKKVYCKAFNVQSENQAVTSNEPTLYVKVRVTSVTLKDGDTTLSGTLEVTSGVSETLTCTTSVSRPTATVIWFIGNVEKKRSTDSTSTFTFKPTNSHHGQKVYCKAFNIQPENQAVTSNEPSLYVKVLATTPTIRNHTGGEFIVLEGDQVTLECTSSQTRPVVTVTWKLATNILTNTSSTTNDHIGGLKSVTSVVTFQTNRTDDSKIVNCETKIQGQSNTPKAQESITVYWPPSFPSIPTTNFPFLEGETGKSIICFSSEYGNPESVAVWNKEYGTPDSQDSRKLNLPVLTYKQNDSPVSCMLQNQYTQRKGIQIQSQPTRIQVEYSPMVQIKEGTISVETITKNEGQSVTIFCNASGNPTPTVEWIGQQPGSAYLTFDDIDRTDHDTYTCRAAATSTKHPSHNFVREKNIPVNVNYAPTVSLIFSDKNPTEHMPLRITCDAEGRPTSYNYTNFIQRWGTVYIPNKHKAMNGVIDIPSLQLQDSGMYICTANNGIQDRNMKLDQSGNSSVLVKVSPKVLLKERFTFAGAPGKSVNLTVPFYSYPDIIDVKFKLKDTVIQNSNKHKVYHIKQKVTTEFYGTEIELEGYVAILHIKDEEESDFTNYTLVLDNGIGQSQEWILYHVSESIPLVPKFINFTGIIDGVPTFSLLGDFNGGRQQTFVIETSKENSNVWVERLRFNETDREFFLTQTGHNQLMFRFNVTGLSPNTYILRVLAGNIVGWIEESSAPNTTFTVPAEDLPTNGNGALIGAVVGSSSGVVVAAIVIVIVIIWKKRTAHKGEGTSALSRSHHENDNESSDDEVMTENLAYVSADEVGIVRAGAVPDTTYAMPQKRGEKVLPSDDPRTLYAVPDKDLKTKKKVDIKGKNGKGVKKGKAKQKRNDDVYENSSELIDINKTGGGKGAYEENPYENPEESKPKVNRNKDGLIYADLTFNDQPKGQKKLVIHGLDSMTEYVEVDFTKKADPLPDSDDETTERK